MSLEFEIIDNSGEFFAELKAKVPVALEMVGLQAENYAKDNIKAAGRKNTGAMINMTTHTVKDNEVYVGNNLMYAVYNELGTGTYATNGNGRKGWWVYVAGQDEKTAAAHRNTASTSRIYSKSEAYVIMMSLRKKGLNAYMTQGIKPIHFLQKAVEEHQSEYWRMIETVMKA